MCVFNMLVLSLLMIRPVIVWSLNDLDIVNYATLGQFPYQVDLKTLPTRDSKNYSVICGGALISTEKVLTLGACLVLGGTDFNKKDVNNTGTKRIIDVADTYLVAGTLRGVETFLENNDSQWRMVASILMSKDLVLAITYARQPFVLNEYVGTIPYASTYLEGDEECVLAGYAVREGNGRSDNLTYGYFIAIPEEEFSVVNADPKKTMYAKYELDARGYPGSALVCFNTSDPNEGPRGVMTGICIGNEYSSGESDYIRLSHYYGFINTSTNIKDIVCKYCLLVTLYNLYMTGF